MDQYLTEEDSAVAAQAFLELSEANVSPVAHADAWATEVGFLHDEGQRGAPDDGGFGSVEDVASLLA